LSYLNKQLDILYVVFSGNLTSLNRGRLRIALIHASYCTFLCPTKGCRLENEKNMITLLKSFTEETLNLEYPNVVLSMLRRVLNSS
jgi:hypothetical protein